MASPDGHVGQCIVRCQCKADNAHYVSLAVIPLSSSTRPLGRESPTGRRTSSTLCGDSPSHQIGDHPGGDPHGREYEDRSEDEVGRAPRARSRARPRAAHQRDASCQHTRARHDSQSDQPLARVPSTSSGPDKTGARCVLHACTVSVRVAAERRPSVTRWPHGGRFLMPMRTTTSGCRPLPRTATR